MNSPTTSWTARFQHWSPRERRVAALTIAIGAIAAVWFIGISPAWRMLQHSGQTKDRLREQLSQMQTLASQAAKLTSKPPIQATQVASTLEAQAKSKFGNSVGFSVQGDRIQVNFKSATPESVSHYLEAARTGSAAVVVDAKLTRGITASGQTVWDGSLMLRLGNPA